MVNQGANMTQTSSLAALQLSAEETRIRMTIPTVEQIFGTKSWLAIRGDMAKPTDLALAQGSDRINYVTQSVSSDGQVIGINCTENQKTVDPWKAEGVRPILPAGDVKRLKISFPPHSHIVTWGEYPQTVLQDARLIKKLDFLKQKQELQQTGKVYTFWEDTLPFVRFVPEYVFKGEKYTLLPSECVQADFDACWSNGSSISVGHDHWFKVEPVRWLKDRAGNLISQKVLFSFPMDHSKAYDGRFRPTQLARFIRDYVDFDILPTKASQKARLAHDALQAEVAQKIQGKTRSAARRYFAKLRGEAQVLAAHILADGTPKRNRTAGHLKQLRCQALDNKIKAKAYVQRMSLQARNYEKRARDEEAEGQRLLKKHLAEAADWRRQGQSDLNDARKKEAKAVKMADQAQAGLRAYWQKHQADRTIRMREE